MISLLLHDMCGIEFLSCTFSADRRPMMRSFCFLFDASPRFRNVSTAFAPHQAHLSRQVHQSQQVATRDRHLILSFHAFKSGYHRSAHRRPCLRPSMYPLGHLPLGLANRVSRISSSACVNGATAWTARVLCHVRRDIARSTFGNKFSRIVVLVGAQRSPPGCTLGLGLWRRSRPS